MSRFFDLTDRTPELGPGRVEHELWDAVVGPQAQDAGVERGLAVAEGDYSAARTHLTTCLTEYRDEAAPHAVAANLEHLARVAIAEGGPERATRLLSAAATLRDIGVLRATDLAGGFQAWMKLTRA